MKAKRIFVQSSELRWVEFDAKNLALRVEFVSGGIYEYHGVPRGKVDALLSANSKGTYFNATIRGHFPFVRIE
jgi:hypothetical protein